ncbi:MAG: hypothetical protein JXQ96_03735 [Cyclobacteriaceae bacterium]
MTKYDIRIKRQSLSKGQIARHKDFGSLRKFESKPAKSGGLIRIILIIIGVGLILGMTVIGILYLKKEKAIPQEDGMEVFDEFKDK